jgi:hypothetical protein
VLPYDKRKGILRIGKLKVAHGFFDGIERGPANGPGLRLDPVRPRALD